MSEWSEKLLGEVCSIEIGGTPSRRNQSYWWQSRSEEKPLPWVSISDMQQKVITQTKESITCLGAKNSNCKPILKGTLLMSFKLTIGKLAFAGTDLYTNEAIAAISPVKTLDRGFLYYGLQHWNLTGDSDQAVKGVTLNKQKLKEIPCLIPPLPEQKRIAEILSGIDKSISLSSLKLKKIEMLINAFRSSVEDVPDYKIYSIQEIISEKTIGTNRRGSGPNKNIPLIKMGDIGRGEIKYIDNEIIEYGTDVDHLILKKGDILFNTRNTPELVGKTAIFSSTGDYTFDNNLMLLRFKEGVIPSFLNQLMNSGHVLQQLFSISSGTTSVAAIYWNDLKKIKLKLPPVEVQEKISANIESLEKIKLKINNKIEILKNLKMGISSDLLTGNKRVVL